MKVTYQIAEPGNLEKERLVVQVVQDDDIGRYVVFLTTFRSPTAVSPLIRRVYWFADKSVKTGDVVVLYTKKGTQSEKQNPDKSTSHFFYWNLDEPIWLEKAAAVVGHLDEWGIANKLAETPPPT